MRFIERITQKGEMMDDKSITREDALNAINRIWDRCEEIEAHIPEGDPDKTGYKMIADYLTVWKYLSAQPEIKADGDAISRQAAIDAVLKLTYADEAYGYADAKDLVDSLEKLPSAQPERKTGRWIQDTVGLMVTEYKCSECGRTVRDDTGYDVYKDYPYCHCGAKMAKTNEVYANEWLGL